MGLCGLILLNDFKQKFFLNSKKKYTQIEYLFMLSLSSKKYTQFAYLFILAYDPIFHNFFKILDDL
jgi:hypothetical protein